MGSPNNVIYLSKVLPRNPLKRVIEIGSKDHGGEGATQDFRAALPVSEYVGVDLEPGPGVDWVCDVTKVTGLPDGNADLVICCSVLEHTPQPWVMAENVASLVKPGGGLFVTVPWVWRYHPYPDDYYRISWRGIQTLFPGFEWLDQSYVGQEKGQFTTCARNADNTSAYIINKRKYLPYMDVYSFGIKQ